MELSSLFPADDYHSSVLRLSSGATRLWTHYDVMDNTLMQARKRCGRALLRAAFSVWERCVAAGSDGAV